MSILLDALRKSEEQRRLGSAPSIHDGSEPPGPGGDSAHQWILLSLIAVSAIAMFWFGWRQYQPPASVAAGADQVAAVAGRSAAPETAPGADGTAVADRTGTQPRTPVESFVTEEVRTPQAHSGPGPDEAVADAQRARVNQSFQDYRAQEGTVGEPEPTGDEAAAPAASDIALEPPPGDPRSEGGAAAPAAGLRPPRSATEPITFWELPQGVRDSMPEIRITVLVYAEQPEDRFLLVSGQRLVEKDELEGGVVLDEIRRDGAVFLYRSYRFLVKG